MKKKIAIFALILCFSAINLNSLEPVGNNFLILTSTISRFCLISSYARAVYAVDGVAICSVDSNQLDPQICSDGAGGAFITWRDYRGATTDIYAQRVSASGNIQAVQNGTAICTATGNQLEPLICADNEGNAIIAWEDGRSAELDIYAQKVNSSVDVQWNPNGIAVCSAIDYQDFLSLCSDGSGGALLAWMDSRVDPSYDIYAQKIDSLGTAKWTPNGVAICTLASTQYHPQICSDGAGGAIIVWEDYRVSADPDIYAQRIDSSGIANWTTNGVAICTADGDQDWPQICSDGAGGAFIIWPDSRNGDYDIYAQRINSSGNFQWAANGTPVCNEETTQQSPILCRDYSGGAIIAWPDKRKGDYDVYAQKVDLAGNIKWNANGTVICSASTDQICVALCSDGSGGAFISWTDYRGANEDIYAQRIDSSGRCLWMQDGVGICQANITQTKPDICYVGGESAIIAWQDGRTGLFGDIYAQKVQDDHTLVYLLIAALAEQGHLRLSVENWIIIGAFVGAGVAAAVIAEKRTGIEKGKKGLSNIKTEIKGNNLILKFNITKKVGKSATEKTIIVANSHGEAQIKGTDLSFGMYAFRYETRKAVRDKKPEAMQNIDVRLDGNTAIINIDTMKKFGPSKSGKSTIVASSRGNWLIKDSGIYFGLNVYKKNK